VLAQVIDEALKHAPSLAQTVTLGAGPTPATQRHHRSERLPSSSPALAAHKPSRSTTTTWTRRGGRLHGRWREDVPPSLSRAPRRSSGGQTFQTILRVYKAATIFVGALNADGTGYLGPATVTISSTRGTQSFPYTFTGAPFWDQPATDARRRADRSERPVHRPRPRCERCVLDPRRRNSFRTPIPPISRRRSPSGSVRRLRCRRSPFASSNAAGNARRRRHCPPSAAGPARTSC